MPSLSPPSKQALLGLAAVLALAAGPLGAAAVPPEDAPAAALQHKHPDLHIHNVLQPAGALPAELSAGALADLGALGVAPGHGFYDLRGARWGSLILSRPLVPGSGAGNTLSWADLGLQAPANEGELADAAWAAFEAWLAANQGALGIDPAELGAKPRVAVHGGGRLVQIWAGRQVGGVAVRDSYLTAAVNSGNLVLFGARNWGEVSADPAPVLSAEQAEAEVARHARPDHTVTESWRATALAFAPLEVGDDPAAIAPGTGYDYRLVWQVGVRLSGSLGSYEALVDATTGELLSFVDVNAYYDGKVRGGVYPVSNDGLDPDGIEQPGFPMPFANVTRPFSAVETFTNSAGLVEDVSGVLRTTLSGRYVRMSDRCGDVDEVAVCSDLDLGTGPGTDCAVPFGHSAGDTHASRSGFYEVNRIVEAAQGWLPGNGWIFEQLTANMNIDDTCNAFWDGQTINFFKSGGGCANTGEIAAVFDHEWGHGLDANDNNPGVSSPGEAIADIYSILRLGDSCMGRGFRPGTTECGALIGGAGLGAYGDPCIDCSGVRDLDYAQHESGVPHDIDWILRPIATQGIPGVLAGGGCVGVPGLQQGPCGQETHCEGMVPAEAGWDLFARDLQGFAGSSIDLDFNSALEIATKLFFQGGHNVGSWYQCAPGGSRLAGCVGDGGYLNLLAADDDNGDLSDGTPHMDAIFRAFDRHQIACVSPTVPSPVNAGCAGGPSEVPIVTSTPIDNGAFLSWSAVPGATRYWVFRTEGVRGCEFGKAKIAEVTDTTYTDTGLLDGFEYFHSVMAVGANDACFSPMSDCASTVPEAGAPEPQILLTFRESPPTFNVVTGDGDPFLDNCEVGRFRFLVENAGGIDQTNVRITDVRSPSHPGIEVQTALPSLLAPVLAGGVCGDPATLAPGVVEFVPHGLAFDEEMVLEVDVVSDQSAAPLTATFRIPGVESDFGFVDSLTFGFDTDGDLEGWRVVSGTYTQEIPGAAGTDLHLASSAFTSSQCDEIRSPEIRLTPTSTLSLFNQFQTEPESLQWYDRANVGLFDVETGKRQTISPDGGRFYNASGPAGVCVTQGEPGWAGAGPGFLPSTWSPAALGVSERLGRRLRLDVAYGTDPNVEGAGFQFDQVVLTDVETQSPDAGSDVCDPPPAIVANDDSATTPFETAVTIEVLANDFTTSPPLTIFAVGAAAGGSAAANPDGTITYTPGPGFSGPDAFSYTIQDGAGLQASATVSVTVGPDDSAPWCTVPGERVADDELGDTTATAAGDPSLDLVSLSVAEPFFGPGQEKLVVTVKVLDFSVPHPAATWRTTWLGPDNVTRFVAVRNCNATTGLTCSYGFLDGNIFTTQGAPEGCNLSSDGTLTVTVDKSLVALDDSLHEGFTLSGMSTRSEVVVGALCSGLLSVTDSTPSAGYTIRTNSSCSSETPDAVDDFASTPQNTAVTIDVLANDSDPQGDPLTVTLLTQPSNGTAVVNGDQTVTYTPDLGFAGDELFRYRACDPDGDCDAANVRVNVHCPTAPDGAFADDFEPGAEPGWTVDTAANNLPASLTWGVRADPFAESPINSFHSDASSLDLKDDRLVAPPQNLSSSSRLVFWHRFNLEGGFDGGVLEVSTNGGSTWVDVVAGGGSFVQGGYNSVISTSAGSPIAGRAAWSGFSQFINAMNRVEVDLGAYAGFNVLVRWRLALDPIALGSVAGDSWTIDDVRFTNLQVIPVDCNVKPIAVDDTATTLEDTPVAIDVLANDSDPNGDVIFVTAVTDPANGTAVDNGDGTVTYTPDSGFVGVDTFDYSISDGEFPDDATVTVTVRDVNRPPVPRDDEATTQRDTPVTIAVLADNGNGPDTDPDGDALTVQNVSDPANGTTVNHNDGTVTYTPDPGFTGTDTFTYDACDPEPLCRSATVTVTVTEGPPPPVARDDFASTQEGTPVTIDVLANDTTANPPLEVDQVSDPAHGTAVDNGDGTITYTPDPGFTGTETFTYSACDATDQCDPATVTVEVRPRPVAGGKITGGGWILAAGDKANFGFNAHGDKTPAKGRLTYDSNGVGLKGTVTGVEVFSATEGAFEGPCTLKDGSACSYEVEVEDNGEPGRGVDRFHLRVFDATGALLHEADGLLGGGNIQIH